jgi:hypothetical protein
MHASRRAPRRQAELYHKRRRGARRSRALPLLRRRAVHQGMPHVDRHPDLHQEDRHRQREGLGADHLRAEHARLLVRARVPGRGLVRRGRASTQVGTAIRSPSVASSATRPRRRRATGKRHSSLRRSWPKEKPRHSSPSSAQAPPRSRARRACARGARRRHLREEGAPWRAQHDGHRPLQAARRGRAARGRVGRRARRRDPYGGRGRS